MELMQRCLPFKWQKYWNCGIKEFDLLMILHDIDNLKLSVQDRLLLTLLARLWTAKGDAKGEIKAAVMALDQEQREILADWMRAQKTCEISPSQAAACPCRADQFS
jgi:hypothetical protein